MKFLRKSDASGKQERAADPVEKASLLMEILCYSIKITKIHCQKNIQKVRVKADIANLGFERV